MLPIRVKGLGMIPRIGRLAPMLTPHPVDLKTLEVIIDTGGMTAEYVDLSGKPSKTIRLDASNYKKVYEQYHTGERPAAVKTKPVVKPAPKAPVVPPKTNTPPPAPPQIPFAVTIDENDVKTSTGVTIEQLASGEVKGKADWWIPQGNDLVPIKAEWIEEDPLPIPPTSPTPPVADEKPVEDKSTEGDIVMKPMGSTDEEDKVPVYESTNKPYGGKKNKNR